jgi:hypothetical protein
MPWRATVSDHVLYLLTDDDGGRCRIVEQGTREAAAREFSGRRNSRKPRVHRHGSAASARLGSGEQTAADRIIAAAICRRKTLRRRVSKESPMCEHRRTQEL